MSSRGKKKTTMAKLSRESRLRERRQDKQAKKDARRRAALDGEVQPVESDSTNEDWTEVTGSPAPDVM